MKINQLRELTVEELIARKRELRKEALHLRIQQASGQLENTAHLKDLRKEVARIETLVSERRIGLALTSEPKKAAVAKAPEPKVPAKKVPAKKADEKPETKPVAKKAATKKAVKKEAS